MIMRMDRSVFRGPLRHLGGPVEVNFFSASSAFCTNI